MSQSNKPLTIGDLLKSEADQQSRVAVPAPAGTKAGQLVEYPLRSEHLVALTDETHGEVLVQPHNCVIYLDHVSEASVTALMQADGKTAMTVDDFVKQGDAHGIKYIGTPYMAMASITASLSINPVADDGVIDDKEDDADVMIAGTAVDVPDGTAVNVSINGKSYQTAVSRGAWEAIVPVADVQALPQGEAQVITVTATVDGVEITATSSVTRPAPVIQ